MKAAIEALKDRILQGDGASPRELRVRAFNNDELPEPLRALIDKVAKRSAQVTDADFAAALKAGFTEDQLFELVICGAIGESSRHYLAGLTALAEAIANRGAD